MASPGLHRAIQMLPNNGISQAKKVADLLLKTNTDAKGDPTIEGLNQAVDSLIQSGYASTIDGQRQVAAYTNKIRDLSQKKEESDNSLASLKVKEYASWYVNEDGNLRDPAFVADVTSQSLDMLIAETVGVIQGKKIDNKDTGELETYLTDLIKRADRMRNVSQGLQSGQAEDLEGYGYYVDTDPNTGKVRGASFMPTDVGSKDIGEGMVRTDNYVQVGSKRVPVFLPYIKDQSGQFVSKFGGKEYIGNSTLISAGDDNDINLKDTNAIPFDGDVFQRGQVYRSFTGKSNIDGTPQQKYIYAGFDNKLYSFNQDDPTGNALIADLKATGSLPSSVIPRINPYTAMSLQAAALPKDPSFLQGQTAGATRQVRIGTLQSEAAAAQATSDQANSFGGLAKETVKGIPGVIGNAFSSVGSGIASFFGRKNAPNQPNTAVPARSGNDVINTGKDTFFSR